MVLLTGTVPVSAALSSVPEVVSTSPVRACRRVTCTSCDDHMILLPLSRAIYFGYLFADVTVLHVFTSRAGVSIPLGTAGVETSIWFLQGR